MLFFMFMTSVMGKKTDIEDTRMLVGENILDVMEYRCRHHYGKDVRISISMSLVMLIIMKLL